MTDPFDANYLGRLERLRLAVARRPAGPVEGERPARRSGPSEEFLDHRPYAPGDDPRYIDWNAAARLSQLVIKQFVARRNEETLILVDASRSMGAKWTPVARIAAGLAAIATAPDSRVEVRRVPGGSWRAAGADADWARLFDLLRAVPLGGPVPWEEVFASIPSRPRRAVVVLSDFWAEGLAPILRRAAAAFDFAGIRILSPGEVDPPPLGAILLRDVETGARHEVVVGDAERSRYAALLAEHEGGLRHACVEAGGAWAAVSSASPVEEVFWVGLREAGVLQ